MSPDEIARLAIGTVQGLTTSAVAILVLFIGFCVLLGFTKTRTTRGRDSVVKSLDESLTHQAVIYLAPTDPRGPADQLRAPDLLERARA